MKKILCLILFLGSVVLLYGQIEVPFYTLFTSKDYNAHNRNFDIVCDSTGQVFIGNYDGLLYFNGYNWRIFKTPDYTRITNVIIDSNNLLWIKNENFSGFLQYDSLHIMTPDSFPTNYYPHSPSREQDSIIKTVFREKPESIMRDGFGSSWVATNQGVLQINYPSAYSQLREEEGLLGEVLSIIRYKGTLYIGTFWGLFYIDEKEHKVVQTKKINSACWNFHIGPDSLLYIASNSGLHQLSSSQNIKQLNQRTVYCITFNGDDLITGEKEGLFINDKLKINHSNVTNIYIDKDKNLWHSTLFGCIYLNKNNNPMLIGKYTSGNNLFLMPGKRVIATSRDGYYTYENGQFVNNQIINTHPDWISKTDIQHWWSNNILFFKKMIVLSDAEGLRMFATGKDVNPFINQMLFPLHNYPIRVIYAENEQILWVGGEFGIIKINTNHEDALYQSLPKVYIRNAQHYDGDCFRFQFSTRSYSSIRKPEYSYKLEGLDNNWSAWSFNNTTNFHKLSSGNYTFHIKARDMFGRESQSVSYQFSIPLPLYLKWYFHIIYFFLFLLLIWLGSKWHTVILKKKNILLKNLVEIRTQELQNVHQKLIQQERMAIVGSLTKGLIDRILNPLNYICNFSELSQLLLPQLLEKDTHTHEFSKMTDTLIYNLKKIEHYGRKSAHILKTTENLLHDRENSFRLYDINKLCDKSISRIKLSHQHDIEKFHIKINCSLPQEPVLLYIIPELIFKTLLLMLENSLYATVNKITNKQLKISLIVQNLPHNIHLLIFDNGIGIDESTLAQIFNPFFSTKTTDEAAGIGLYICQENIRTHHGHIDVISRKDEFTLFKIILPKKEN